MKRNGKRNSNKSFADRVNKTMTVNEYYELFIKPGLQLLAKEKEQRLGVAFIRWIVYGTLPAFKDDGDKLLWNALMFACNKEFNPVTETLTAAEVQKQMSEAERKKKNNIERMMREMLKG